MSVSASCGLSYLAIWGAPAQQQKLRRCIDQTVADHCQVPATAPSPFHASPTVSCKPNSHDGKQASPCSQAGLQAHIRDRLQVHDDIGVPAGNANKTSIRGQKLAHIGLSLPPWPVAATGGRCINTAQEGANKPKLDAMACDEDVDLDAKVTDATAWIQDSCAVASEQPVPAAQKPSKRLKSMSAVLPKAGPAVCKQEETETRCSDAAADRTTKGLSCVRCTLQIPALNGLIKQVPPQKARSRRAESGPRSQSGLRSHSVSRGQGVKADSSSFRSAAAASEMTANTDQPQALHRCQCSSLAMKFHAWNLPRLVPVMAIARSVFHCCILPL